MRLKKMEDRPASAAMSEGSLRPLGEVPSGVLSLLVIDDDPEFCRLAKRCLDDFAEVEFRFGVPKAGQLEVEAYDVILLDYRLPVRDGIEILEEIRAVSSDIPVIFLTGYGDPALAEFALSKGATCFLPKPVQINELRAEIQKAHEKRGMVAKSDRVPVSQEVAEPEFVVHESPKDFSATTAAGTELEGIVSRFGYRSVFVNLPQRDGVTRGSDLNQVAFRFGDQFLECGRGMVGEISRSSSDRVEVEVILAGLWGVTLWDEEAIPKESGKQRVSPDRVLMEDWSKLLPEFRLSVNELAESLDTLWRACEESEAEKGEDPVSAFSEENHLVSELADRFGEVFWDAIIRFEKASIALENAGEMQLGKRYARRVLYPYVLASPFLSRVVERPIGVPGDFGMLGQILGNPLEGYDIYGRIVNSWILSCGAAAAYRYRVDLLHREILGAVETANRDLGRPAKILSMASGVAYEVQRFIQSPPASHRVSFSLVDFSEVTLNEAERQYSMLGEIPEGIELGLHQSSVIDLANRSRGVGLADGQEGFVAEDDYDFVYCAGLFDYLSDRLIVKVTRYLFGLLAENGKLVVSNFTVENPIRSWMTYVMDWELLYRSEEQFESLVRRAVGEEAELIRETDSDGVEVYALVKK